MDIKAVSDHLDDLLNQDWSKADRKAKEQVIRLISGLSRILGNVAMEAWAKRISYHWGLPLSQVLLLISDVEEHGHLLDVQPSTPIPPIDHPFPKTGWLGDYLEYTLNSEAPYTFHFWVGVAVLSGIFGRNVYHQRGHACIYPNHYIILVAPSGRCKKTSAADIGVELLYNIPNINIVAEKITPEALAEALQSTSSETKECRGFIYAPELPVFLGKQQYNEGMIDLLTRIADSPAKWEYRTRTKKIVQLTNLYATLLACVTPSKLSTTIPETAFGGGFMSRIMFIMQKVSDRTLAHPPPRNAALREELIERLKVFSNTKACFTYTPEALEWYTKWYAQLQKEANKIDDERLSGYFARKHDHLLRLTMILILSADASPVFTVPFFEETLTILNKVETIMPDAFISAGDSIVGANSHRILEQLKKAGPKGLSKSELTKKNYRYGSGKAIQEILYTLKQGGLIDTVSTGGREIWLIKKEEV